MSRSNEVQVIARSGRWYVHFGSTPHGVVSRGGIVSLVVQGATAREAAEAVAAALFAPPFRAVHIAHTYVVKHDAAWAVMRRVQEGALAEQVALLYVEIAP